MQPNQTAYRILNPTETHYRPATCEEVGCQHYLEGWQSLIDEATELGQRQAAFIRGDRTRRHTEARNEAGITVFTFEAGQSCFRAGEHRTNVGRAPLYVVDTPRDGRVQRRLHSSPDSWGDDLRTHQEDILGGLNKG